MFKKLFGIFVCFLFILNSSCSLAKIRIFILLSYHQGDICSDLQYNGLLRSLEELEEEHEIKAFYLDSRHLKDDALSQRIQKAIRAIRHFTPDILITVDDLAFTVALKHFLGREFPIVFSGVNQRLNYYNSKYHFLDDHGYPTKNVTGVHERIFAKQAIKFMDDWIGNSNYQILVLYSPDVMGNVLKDELLDELKATPFLKRIILKRVSDVRELKEELTRLSTKKIKAYFPFTMSLPESPNGKRKLSLTELAPILIRYIKIPDLFPNSIGAAKLGLLGGVGTDFFRMGYQAGIIALKILQGWKIRDLPVEEAMYYTIAINLKRAKECHLPIRDDILSLSDYVFQ